jgi:hypothetical protein
MQAGKCRLIKKCCGFADRQQVAASAAQSVNPTIPVPAQSNRIRRYI